MITAESPEVTDILTRVSAWPSEARAALARRILAGLRHPDRAARRSGYWAAEVIAALRMPQPAPDDATVKRWIAEGRQEKYGT
jgi:hypothetical protein